MPLRVEAGLAAREHVPVDELAVGDDEQHAAHDLAGLLVRGLLEHAPVEHCLLERDRQRLLRAEADRVRELALVVDAGDLERADADAVVRDAEPHALLRQLVLREQLLERRRERLDVAKLAADDDAVGERRARDLQELRASRRS